MYYIQNEYELRHSVLITSKCISPLQNWQYLGQLSEAHCLNESQAATPYR